MADAFVTSVGLESGFQQLHTAWVNNGGSPDYAGVATAITGIIGSLGPFAQSFGIKVSADDLTGALSASGASLGASFVQDWASFNDPSLTPAQHLTATLSLVADVGQALQYIPPLEGPATGLVLAANGLQLFVQDSPGLQNLINDAGVNYAQTGTFNFFSIEKVDGGAVYTASPNSDGAYNTYFYSSNGNNTAIVNNEDGTSFIGSLDVQSNLVINDILNLPKGTNAYYGNGNFVYFNLNDTALSVDLTDPSNPTLSSSGGNYFAYSKQSGVDANSLTVVSIVSGGVNESPTLSSSPLTPGDNAGNYVDSNTGGSFRIVSGEILTAVTPNSDGSWTVSSPLTRLMHRSPEMAWRM